MRRLRLVRLVRGAPSLVAWSGGCRRRQFDTRAMSAVVDDVTGLSWQ